MQTVPIRIASSPACVLVWVFILTMATGCARRQEASPSGPGATQGVQKRGGRAERERALEAAASAAGEKRAEAQARYAAGLIHELRDEADQALENFQKSLEADPSQEPLLLELARRHLLRKEPEKAAQLLQDASPAATTGIPAALLASIYISLGKTNEAIAANLQSIDRSPGLLIGYHNLAGLYVRQDQPEEALKILERASRVPDPHPQFLVELAELWLGFPQASTVTVELTRRKAAELLDRAVAAPELQSPLRQRAADAYLLMGQNQKAIDLYLKLVEEFPQATPIRERLADLFLQARDSKRAIEQMEALIQEEPSRYPQAYWILGSLALQEGKFKVAEDHLRKALVLAPKNEAIYYDLAVAQVNGGRLREGLDTLDDARGRFKETFQSEFFSGIAHARLKEYPKAVARLTAAEVIASVRETNRLTHLFFFQLGSTHERNKDLDEAERYFRKALTVQPDFGEALNYLGYMWAEAGIRLDEAKTLIEKAVALEPKNAAFLDSMAWVYHKLGKHQEALIWMQKAMENHSDEPDPTLHDHLADIHAALGERAKAIEAWKEALKIEPNAEIEKKLQEAESKPGSD